MAKEDTKPRSLQEPSVVVKRLGRLGGLDGIHLSLMVLVVIMAALLLVVTYNRSTGPVLNISGTQVCTYGAVNGSCVNPIHNQSQVALIAGRFLASYALVNSSFSVIPYISAVNATDFYYSPASDNWYVMVPEITPQGNSTSTFWMQLVINDKNSSVLSFIQNIAVSGSTQNYVQSYGVVRLAGKSACEISNPTQVYWFIDPYAPGSVKSVAQLASIENKLGSKVGAHLEVLFTQASQTIANSYGLNDTLAFGQYLFCASQQANFSAFAKTVNATYHSQYISPGTLSVLATDSDLNLSTLGSCLASAAGPINRQSVLANYYNVTSTPLVVTNCQYQSIPQTVSYALCAANSTLC